VVTPQENIKVAVSPKYQPQVESGESLYFKLRANPIVRKKENGRAKDCDIVMDAKHQFKRKGQSYLNLFSMDELIHNVGMQWLIRKGEHHGFMVKELDVKIDNYQEYSVKAAGKQSFALKTLDFEGKLKITDVNSFKTALFEGIGRSKAFGCGLMLVRRI
jgi:CRISPR system Cascade subunit CasE